MDNNVLELQKVSKIYGTQLKNQVLFDIDLHLKKGSFNAVIGQSGSGKSTLLNIIGILDRPSSGKVFVNGEETSKLSSNKLAELRNKTLGFIFQFHYLIPEFTALENVLMPYWIKNTRPPSEIVQRAEELMDKVGILPVKNNLANKMSGGQQQRTAIARSLINNPEIVLADEPTGNLDSENTEVVYKILREINRDLGTTFIIVTHDRHVAQMADRIIEIKDGKIYSDINALKDEKEA